MSEKPIRVLIADDHALVRQVASMAATASALANPPDMASFNDVSEPASRTGDPSLDNAAATRGSPSELYDRARAVEAEINMHYRDARAAQMAVDANLAFADAEARMAGQAGVARPDLSADLDASKLETVGDLNRFREGLEQATGEADSMEARSRLLVSQAKGTARDPGERSAFVRSIRRPGGGGGSGAGGGGGAGGDAVAMNDQLEQKGGAFMPFSKHKSSVRVDHERVLAQAMPGRRISSDAERQGWLYVNTWYIIGPWENGGAIEYENTHPPEFEIDFDAEYLDGKQGVFTTSTKEQVEMDGRLKWRFTQCDSIRVLPYVQSPDSTFYAYTEVFAEEAMDMVVGIPSDDCTKVWVNGEKVWEEFGQSGWGLSESFTRVSFAKGANTVLIRLENGPHQTQFSFFICPEDAVRK